MEVRIDFVNEHHAGLLGQVRRIAIVLCIASEEIGQPLQNGLGPLAEDVKREYPRLGF